MRDLVYSMLPIVGLQLLALVAALFVHLQTPGRGVVKMLVVPLALAGVLVCPLLFAQLMGYSVSWGLPEKFTFLAFNPVVRNGVKTGLEVWLREDGSTRLYRMPYSKQMEQMLKDAARGAKGGRQAKIMRKGKGEPGADDSPGRQEWILKFDDPTVIPKDPVPSMPAQPEADEEEPITKRYSI